MPPATLAIENSRSKNTHSDDRSNNRSARLLLALWFLGGESDDPGKLKDRAKLAGEKRGDCQEIFEQLLKDKAIQVIDKKVLLTDKGKDILAQKLRNTNLGIEADVAGSWMIKALLQWIQQADVAESGRSRNGKAVGSAIASYDEFKQIVLSTYNRLNRDYNLDNLVPIYRIRREIGDQVSRSYFDEWLLEMQANDILQLLEGSVEDSAPDKLEDSITTKVSGLRCYAKRLDT